MRFYISLILIVLLSDYGIAQPVAPGYIYEHWTRREGLPSNGITDIVSTGDGYLWLSTFDGLVRFNGVVRNDGQLFSVFNKSNISGLSTSRIKSIDLISEKEYFLTTEYVGEAENVIHVNNRVFTSYGQKEGLRGKITGTQVDKDGYFWVASDGRLMRFEAGEWTHYYPEIKVMSRSSEYNAPNFFIDNINNLWALDDSELVRVSNGNIKRYSKADGLLSNDIHRILKTKNGDVWAVSDQGINIIKRDTVTVFPLPEVIDPAEIIKIYEDESTPGRIIIRLSGNTEYEFYEGEYQLIPRSLIDRETGAITEFELLGSENETRENSKWQVLNNKVFESGKVVFETELEIQSYVDDKRGGLWLAAENKLFRFHKSIFKALTQESHQIANVYPIIQDHEGVIWAGGLTGQVYRGPATDGFDRFDSRFPTKPGNLLSIFEDKDRNMWFGHQSGILFWDREREPVHFPAPFSNKFAQVRAIYLSEEDTLWFGTELGVYFLDGEGEWNTLAVSGEDKIAGIKVIYEDRKGRLWFGTNGDGLLYKDGNEVKRFARNADLSDTIVRSIYQDGNGIMWVGMEGGGLNRIEITPDDTIITHYNQQNGLFGAVIHSILEDEHNRLWMSSNQGIFWVTREELNAYAEGDINHITSTSYNESDGLPGMEANGGVQSAGIITREGEMLFPMIQGVAMVDPDDIDSASIQINTRIEALSTSDTTYVKPESRLTLQKTERRLQFDFVGYDYNVSPENIHFRYRLEGYEDGWNEVKAQYDAIYTNVPSGNYTFILQASIAGDDWEQSSSSLSFSIAPFFWETRSFIILILAAFLGSGFLAYKWRIRYLEESERQLSQKVDEQTSQLKKQAKRLRKLDEAKSRFFANISHEFRTPLTLTIGPLEDIRKTGDSNNIPVQIRRKAALALRNSKRLLRLVNQILDISKIETGNLVPRISQKDFTEFTSRVGRAFLGLAEKREVTYTINLPDTPVFVYFDEDMMEKIIGNLLSNAFKHTPVGGEIRLIVENQESTLTLKVEDSGKGIPKQKLGNIFERFYQMEESGGGLQQGTGIGLSLVKELVDQHKGKISVESEEKKGTVFMVRILKGKEHFPDELIKKDGPLESIFKDESYLEVDFEDEEGLAEQYKPQNKHQEDSPGVLIIDDNADIRRYIRGFLQGEYRVFESDNGEEGLALAKEELPDLIICDVMMPVMDGYEFTKQLRKEEQIDFIPLILLTAKAEQDDKLEGLSVGANDYILKPFDIEEVKLKVGNLIKSQKRLQAHLSENVLNIEFKKGSPGEEFLVQVKEVIESNISNEGFGVDQFAEEMALSRTTLFAKMKEYIGKTPSELLWETRLEQGAELLKQRAGNITEIAYSVGFKSVAHFSRSFKKKFKVTPRTYQKENN